MSDEKTLTIEATASVTVTTEDVSESNYQPPFEFTNGDELYDPFFALSPLIATDDIYIKS